MPAWSPDGSRLVVARNLEPAKSDLVMVNVTDGTVRTLAQWGSEHGTVGPVAWSPNGQHVVYVLHPPDSRGPITLQLLSVSDGSSRLLLERGSGRPMPWKPHWAPDGESIFFTGLPWETQTWMMRDFLAGPS